MSLRHGLGASRIVTRKQRTNAALERAVKSVVGSNWENLETRVLMAVTPPTLYYTFDVPPDSGDTVVDTGTLLPHRNGTLVASADPDAPNGVDEDTPGEKPARVSDVPTAEDNPLGGAIDGRLSFNGTPENGGAQGYYEGSGGRVDITGGLQDILGKSATVAAWIKTQQIGETDYWRSPGITGVEQGGAGNDIFYGILTPEGKIAVRAGDGGQATSTTTVNDGKWHFVAATRDMNNGEVAIYVDGNLEDTSLSETGVKSSRITSIGAVVDVAGDGTTIQGYNHWNGELDEVAIWDRVLHPNEVAEYYNTQAGVDVSATAVAAPTGITATSTGPNSINVSFTDAATNETAYELYRSTSPTATGAGLVLVRTWQKDPADPTAPQSGGTITITSGNLLPSTQYYYFVRGVNAGTPGAFSAPVNATTDALPTRPVPAGAGAYGEFFNVSNNLPNIFADPVATRVDTVIDFDFGNGSPDPAVNADNHSGRWTGKIGLAADANGNGTPGETIPITFITNTDDGAFLWVNGETVAFDQTYHGQFDRLPDKIVNLTEGQAYPFQYQWFEGGGGSGAHLKVVNPANGQIVVIPAASYVSSQRGPVPTPSNLRATNLDINQATIVWDNENSTAQNYFITVTDTATGAFQEITTTPDGSPTTVSGLLPGHNYSVSVKGYNIEGGMSAAATTTFLTPTTPAAVTAPTLVRVLPRAGATPVVFTDNSSNESVFSIERKTGAGAFAEVGTVSASAPGLTGGTLTFTDTTTAANTTYTYRVVAVGQGGASAPRSPSNELSVTPGIPGVGLLAKHYETRFFAPNPSSSDADPYIDHDRTLDENWGSGGPTFLEADPSSADPDDTWSIIFSGQIRPEFTENYTFYTGSDDGIDISIVDPATGQVILSGPPGGIDFLRGIGFPYQDTVGTVALTAGKKYDIQVRWTENGGGAAWRVAWSSPSVPFEPIPNAVLFEPDTTVAPYIATTDLAARPDVGGITLRWSSLANNETGFQVERKTGAAGTYALLTTTGADATSYLDATAVNGTTYVYRIRPINAAGNGPYSNEATVTAGGPGGTGLRATVYDTRFFQDDPANPNDPKVVLRSDGNPNLAGNVNFDVGGGQVDPQIDAETFSIVWEGQLVPTTTEPYTFYTASDDGIELKVWDPDTGAALIDWNNIQALRGIGRPGDNAGTANLVAGKKYNIEVRMTENGGGAAAELRWSSPTIPTEIISPIYLFPATAASTSIVAPRNADALGLCDEYVDVRWEDFSINETGYVLERSTSPTTGFTTIATLGPNEEFYRDTNGTDGLAADTTYYYRVHAMNGATAGPTSNLVTYNTAGGSTAMQHNGTAQMVNGRLRLTNNVNSQTGGAFFSSAKVNGPWTASFDFVAGGPGLQSGTPADGFMFVIQRVAAGATALGGGGGALGWNGIGEQSAGVKFDIYPNLNQTGYYVGGANINDAADPTTGVDVPGTFDFNGGQPLHVTLTYNPTTQQLVETIDDIGNAATAPFSVTYEGVDISGAIGGEDCAFIGFTGATGGENARQEITAFRFNGVDYITAPAAGAHVSNVYVAGSSWASSFKTYMAGQGLGSAQYGYSVPAADQLNELPWTNLNQISITFDSNVTVAQDDLQVRGVNVPTYGISNFAYDATTHTGTWTLSQNVINDKLMLDLDASGTGVVGLDGDWNNAGDTFPSGDGTAGGNFKFRINVLPGDANRDGRVNAVDLSNVRARQLTSTTNPGTAPSTYNIFSDVNGTGNINAVDLSGVRSNQLKVLPTPDPTAILTGTALKTDSITKSVFASGALL